MKRRSSCPSALLLLPLALLGCAELAGDEPTDDLDQAEATNHVHDPEPLARQNHPDAPLVITLRSGIREIQTPALEADRPALSPDGRRLVYSVEEPTPLPFFILSAYEVEARRHGRWSAPRLLKQGVGAVISGTVESWFFPTYRPDDDGFLVGLGAIDTDETGLPDLATLRASFLHLSQSGATEDTVLSALDLGLPFGEIPDEQRYSPDGRWIVFAAHAPAVQGLYLHEVATGALSRLTTEPDLDPAFSTDGKTILFHTRRAGESAPTHALGALRLRFAGGGVTASRRLIEPRPGLFPDEEHPAPIVGSDVLWFHARPAADGLERLAVRRSCAAWRIELAIEVGGRRLVEAERPTSALYTRDVAFMGKFEGDVHHRIFAIDGDVVDGLTDLVEALPCPRSAP